jgi:hypothetical protein
MFLIYADIKAYIPINEQKKDSSSFFLEGKNVLELKQKQALMLVYFVQ